MAHFVRRRSGSPTSASISLLLCLSVLGHPFRVADEDARINAQRPADQAKYHDCANAEAGTAPREAATIFYSIACR
jgi:hypothetical protein